LSSYLEGVCNVPNGHPALIHFDRSVKVFTMRWHGFNIASADNVSTFRNQVFFNQDSQPCGCFRVVLVVVVHGSFPRRYFVVVVGRLCWLFDFTQPCPKNNRPSKSHKDRNNGSGQSANPIHWAIRVLVVPCVFNPKGDSHGASNPTEFVSAHTSMRGVRGEG